MKTPTPTPAVRIPRKKSILTIIFRRSYLSVITPAGRVKMSHGSLCATGNKAMSRGDRVVAVANHGYATDEIPSPILEVAVAIQSFQKFFPSLLVMVGHYTSDFQGVNHQILENA
jgi:hypothetical protein